MNMHGIIAPADDIESGPRSRFSVDAVRDWVVDHRAFLLAVVLPSFLVFAYLYLVSSDQYESEAHYLVRSTSQPAMPMGGMSEALSMVTGVSAAQNESMSVADYLTSHDVVDTLRREDNLVARFHRSGVDYFSKLSSPNPAPETLLKYYREQVMVHYNTETGITTLKVRSFTPQDSFDITRKLLELGEARVNVLNERSYNDSIAVARRQLGQAEQVLQQNQLALTRLRQTKAEIDPAMSGQAQTNVVATLTGQLSGARAQLSAMGRLISTNSPQYQALAARVRAMEAQLASQSGRIAGTGGSIASNMGGFQELQLRQEFLAKRYEAAAAALERAREDAIRQQLYIVRVVDANMPVKATYPHRANTLLTVIIALLLAYSIGWLIVAGVKEHAA